MLSHVVAGAGADHPYRRQANRTLDTYERSTLWNLVRPADGGRWDRPQTLREELTGRIAFRPSTLPDGALATRSRFEELALRVTNVPPKAGDILDVLLGSTLLPQNRGCEVLHPLWMEEAVHRAYNFVRLVDARDSRDRAAGSMRDLDHAVAWEDAITCDLADCFEALTTGQERDLLPCATILLGAAAGLGALFASTENITIESRIDDVQLPGYKRRALVLATVELICNALLHGFPARASGQIEVHLAADGAGSACLRVTDNGVGLVDRVPNLARGVAAGLAGLLEADLTYDRIAGWTIAEVAFPLST